MNVTLTPGFTEEWFHESSQVALAALVSSAPDGLVIEIGSWEGRSTCALANAAHPRPVHAVDTWRGTPHEQTGPLAAQRDIHAQFLVNVDHYTKGNVVPHRMGWREYVPTITEPVGLVFIDAEHTYNEVRDNIAAFLPLMADGGIICGDDAAWPAVARAVLDAFGDRVWVTASIWWVTA